MDQRLPHGSLRAPTHLHSAFLWLLFGVLERVVQGGYCFKHSKQFSAIATSLFGCLPRAGVVFLQNGSVDYLMSEPTHFHDFTLVPHNFAVAHFLFHRKACRVLESVRQLFRCKLVYPAHEVGSGQDLGSDLLPRQP